MDTSNKTNFTEYISGLPVISRVLTFSLTIGTICSDSRIHRAISQAFLKCLLLILLQLSMGGCGSMIYFRYPNRVISISFLYAYRNMSKTNSALYSALSSDPSEYMETCMHIYVRSEPGRRQDTIC